MSHLPLSALHFSMVEFASLRASLGPSCRVSVAHVPPWPRKAFALVDACPTVNTRSTFAELAVELGLREVES